MLIDCDTCSVRGAACRECVVTMILDGPASPAGTHSPGCGSAGSRRRLDVDAQEEAAIGALADAGLVPPLRLVPVLRPAERGIA